jgi:hypothetical protein
MSSLYHSLLHLYPAGYRREFGEEMLTVFRQAQMEAEQQGMPAPISFWVREVQGLLTGALREHLRPMTPASLPLRLSRRLSMHSEFRFPKSTVTLMIIILGAVVVAIEKATAIVNSVPHTSPRYGPIQPEHFTLLPTLLMIVCFACVSGTLGWLLLFALRRSGVQRLADFDPARETNSGGRLSA